MHDTAQRHHTTPGGSRPAAVYQVAEFHPIPSDTTSDTAAIVGRSNDGIHLLIDPDTAHLIATAITEHTAGHPTVGVLDHLVVDLLAARAMVLSATYLGQPTLVSGYVTPRGRRTRHLVDAATGVPA